jgi:DnaJ-domain-containing protein 1
MFFKKQLFYESENSNSRYDNNSQYDYRHNRQQEHTSSNNQNNYKKQDDETSNNNNNYQYENKQNEQSYHKSSDSKQHSTFDDRLDELKSNIAKCYEILEVPQNATPSEIKSAFKKKMISYHPDKVSGLGEKLRKVAEEESKLINVAYQTLKSKKNILQVVISIIIKDKMMTHLIITIIINMKKNRMNKATIIKAVTVTNIIHLMID